MSKVAVIVAATLASFAMQGEEAVGIAQRPAESGNAETETRFRVNGMSCADCSNHAIRVLEQIPGVLAANVDFGSKQATIKADRQIAEGAVRAALATLGFEALFAGDPVIEPLSPEGKKALDIKTASTGAAIRVKDHLASGKITIFDYQADWCGPCHLLSPKLERLLLKYPDLALRTIDIVDWESEVAKQATREFGVPGLPYVRLYGPAGDFLGEVHGNQIEKVEEIIMRKAQ